MRAMSWTCDRCGARVEVPSTIHHYDDEIFGHVMFERQSVDLPDWQTFHDREKGSVTHACPGCVTAGERADALLHDVVAEALDGGVL